MAAERVVDLNKPLVAFHTDLSLLKEMAMYIQLWFYLYGVALT